MKTAKNYFLDENYNCAETSVRLANDKYGLEMTEDKMKLVSGFAGGLGCGLTCGILCGYIAALSEMLVETKGHDSEELKPACSEYVKRFTESFGSVNCNELKPKYRVDDNVRCLGLVEAGAKLFDELMNELKENKDAE